MTRFFLALLRLISLTLSFALSTFAAAAFVTFVLFLGSDTGWLQKDPFVALGAIAFMMAMWLSMAQLSFYPSLAAFCTLEFGRMSSLFSNLLAGGFCAFAAMVLLPEYYGGEALPYEARDIWLAMISAGFVGGLTHWILAGHRSGRWLGPQGLPSNPSNDPDAY
ncbi:MAG: hypothetical protein V3V02_04350 [Rhizobiaceae bacterium]